MGPNEEALNEFCNTTGEVHPVWFGFCEAIGVGAQIPLLPEWEVRNLVEEMHYCLLGITIAGVTLAGLVGVGAGIPIGVVFGPVEGILGGAAAAVGFLLYWLRRIAPEIQAGIEQEIRAALAGYDLRRGL